jgi:hypothetical protein
LWRSPFTQIRAADRFGIFQGNVKLFLVEEKGKARRVIKVPLAELLKAVQKGYVVE